MKTDICSTIEVKEVSEKQSIILFNEKSRYSGTLVQCISEDDLKDQVVLVPVTELIRKGKRIFVKKSNIAAFVDKDVVVNKESMSKSFMGNLMNYNGGVSGIEYIDQKAKSHRRS